VQIKVGQQNTELGEQVVVCAGCRVRVQEHVTENVPRSASGRSGVSSVFDEGRVLRHAGAMVEGGR
jgi:hypothetical protein